jgi:hypothetical protein
LRHRGTKPSSLKYRQGERLPSTGPKRHGCYYTTYGSPAAAVRRKGREAPTRKSSCAPCTNEGTASRRTDLHPQRQPSRGSRCDLPAMASRRRAVAHPAHWGVSPDCARRLLPAASSRWLLCGRAFSGSYSEVGGKQVKKLPPGSTALLLLQGRKLVTQSWNLWPACIRHCSGTSSLPVCVGLWQWILREIPDTRLRETFDCCHWQPEEG